MTDAIDREQHRVGAADQTRQQTVTIFDAAVMVKKSGTGPLGDLAQMPDLRRPAANVKQCRVQAGGVLSDSDVASWASKGIEFALQRRDLRFRGLPGPLLGA